MCGSSLKKAGEGVFELLIGNGFDTFDPRDLDLKMIQHIHICIA